MSAAKHTGPCEMTETRLKWLRHLAKNGETGWTRMPKNARGWTGNNRIWVPMREAGWITARFYAPRAGMEPTDHYFAITDAGRAAIAKAVGRRLRQRHQSMRRGSAGSDAPCCITSELRSAVRRRLERLVSRPVGERA